MSLIVMKFGGTSVATAESRQAAIDHVKAELRAGNRVVAVVSAMGRKGAPYATDTLLGLLRGGDLMVKDQLISCGVPTEEQKSQYRHLRSQKGMWM